MLDWMFIMLLVIAIVLTLLVIFDFKMGYDLGIFWNSAFITLSIILWFTLAASQMEIEIPYQMYNATSGFIETGYHIFRSPISPYISYFFSGMGMIMMVYFVMYIYYMAIKKPWVR